MFHRSRLMSALGLMLAGGFAAANVEATVYSTNVVQDVGADLDLSAAKTYTHKLDFPGDGNSAPVNGVQFSAVGAGAGVDPLSGNAYSLSMANPSNFSSGSSSLLADFIHNGAQPAGAVETVTLGGLTLGTTYEARFYYRDFGARPNTVTVNAGSGNFVVGTVDQDTNNINENYFSVVYKATNPTATFSFQQQVGNDSWHQYAISNEVFGGVQKIQNLFNTGVDAGSAPQADNSIDTHWTLSGVGAASGAGPGAIVATSAGGFPIGPWLGDNTASAWITPAADTQGPGATDFSAVYFYSTQFSTTEAGILQLDGLAAADNGIVSFTVDGVAGQFLPGGFNAFSAFSFDGLVNAGLHTIVFGVHNGGGEGSPNGPNGLRVQFTAAQLQAIPEPASAGLLLLSGAALLRRSRRRLA